MNNSELNKLLASAKKAQQYWDRWENEGTFDGSPLVETLSQSVKTSWESLHQAIRESVPCNLYIDETWTIRIGTVGILMDDLWMHYSENLEDGKNTIEEVYLRSVESIEKVEDQS